MSADRIVAVARLTQESLNVVGSCLKKVFPVQQAACFDDLIAAIDVADREYRCDSNVVRLRNS